MSQQDELLEIYKLHVEMTDRASRRRDTTNQIYVSILSALLGIVAFTFTKDIEAFESIMLISIGILGILICTIWEQNILSYRRLSSAKFKVLNEIEDQLAYPFYKKEWEILKGSHKYKTLTSFERIIPIVLMVPFAILIVYGMVG